MWLTKATSNIYPNDSERLMFTHTFRLQLAQVSHTKVPSVNQADNMNWMAHVSNLVYMVINGVFDPIGIPEKLESAAVIFRCYIPRQS